MKLITQAYVIAILSKAILALIIILRDAGNSDRYDMSNGTYHFITLFGMLVFVIAIALEIHKKNYVVGLVAIVGLIIFQPIIPVFKRMADEDSVYVNADLLDICLFALLLWIIYDIVMLIITVLKNKKPVNS
jgi:uncharacterized protein with PQ loop repeat